ncbi:MAG: LAGLIDADG family homing endonuclease, partial [Candidatus Caldarchaeales archaeon]
NNKFLRKRYQKYSEEPIFFKVLTDEELLRINEVINKTYQKRRHFKDSIYIRMVKYRKVFRLHKEGLSLYEISKEIGVSFSTIYFWFKGHHPLSQYIVPDLNWYFGYIIGAAIGDGAVSRSTIIFSWLKDKDFADAIADSAKNIGLNAWVWKKRGYQVAMSNTILADIVLIGKRHATTLLPLLLSDKDVSIGVLSGWFDAEGRSGLSQKSPYDAPRASSTNIEIINLMKALLDNLRIHSTIIKEKSREFISPSTKKRYKPKSEYVYSLRIRRCCVVRFKHIIGFRIKRKQEELVKLTNTKFKHICPIQPSTPPSFLIKLNNEKQNQ